MFLRRILFSSRPTTLAARPASLIAPSMPQRMFSAAKAATSTVVKEDQLVETKNEEEDSSELRFVRAESNLRQVFIRAPNDGLYPVVKHEDDMVADDVEPLIKANLSKVLRKLIEREVLDPSLTHALVSQLHDKDGRMIERIYERLLKERMTKKESVGDFMSPLHYNLMLQSAAVYKRHRLMQQLILETTVLGVPVDT